MTDKKRKILAALLTTIGLALLSYGVIGLINIFTQL